MDALSSLGEAAANLVRSPALSNGSTPRKATASSFPTMLADVCVHVTVLRAPAIRPPMKVRAWWSSGVQRRQGLPGVRIVSMDESTAIHPAQMLPPRTHVSVTPTSVWSGAGQWFNRLRGSAS